jgi:hypothetical protein
VLVAGCALGAVPAAWGTVSGTNGPLAFVRYLRCASNPNLQGQQIYRIGAAGTGLKNLSQSVCAGYSDQFPAWSPDGSKIAFDRSGPNGISHVFVMNADGTDQTQLTTGTSNDYGYVTWSPTGTQIAFFTPTGISIMNADGSDPTEVPNTADAGWHIAWSPDGTRIAFTARNTVDNKEHIYTESPSGADLTDLTAGTGSYWEGADWSPSGTQILTLRCPDYSCDSGAVWTLNADGSGATELTSEGASSFIGAPVWSPNGSMIAFGNYGSEISTMNAHGSNQSLFAAGSEPSWGVPFSPPVQAPGTPTFGFSAPSRLTAGAAPTVPEQTTWTASPTAGVTYELQQQVNGGAWTTIYSGAAPQFTSDVSFGDTYGFQVRAVKGSSSSAWQPAASFTVIGSQQTAFSTTGKWTATSSTNLWGGSAMFTKASGATASLSFTGHAFAIIGNMGSGNGSARVYVDGTLTATANEHASSTTSRNIVGQWSTTTSGSHSLKIINSATSGHPRFDLDGLVVFQ